MTTKSRQTSAHPSEPEDWREQLRREVSFEAVRGSGPGGQNVNKVSSSAILYWRYRESNCISGWEKERIGLKLARLINKQGELYLRSDEFRDLERNKERCLEKLISYLKEAWHVPKPRKKTRPSKSSQRARVESKVKRGEHKKTRQKVRY